MCKLSNSNLARALVLAGAVAVLRAADASGGARDAAAVALPVDEAAHAGTLQGGGQFN